MATVYIWDNTALTGHASILIANIYVSFHPNFSNNPKLNPDEIIQFNKSHNKNMFNLGTHSYIPFYTKLEQDIKKYGKPINKIDIDFLDEDMIVSYIKDGLTEEHKKYHLFTCNCSTVVAVLLFIGIHEYLIDATFTFVMFTRMRHWNAITYQDANQESKTYNHRKFEHFGNGLEKIEPAALVLAKKARNPALMTISVITGAMDFIRRAFFWTPGDILHLALYLRDHPEYIREHVSR